MTRHQLRQKIEKIRRKGGFLKSIQEMEKKVTAFTEEIQAADVELA